MSIRFDMSKLIAAKAKLQKRNEQKALEVTQKITLDVGRRLIEGTPVDTGEARGGWQIDTPTAPGQPGRVSNNVPHIIPLANGHSDQAPNGWIPNAVEAAARSGGSE